MALAVKRKAYFI